MRNSFHDSPITFTKKQSFKVCAGRNCAKEGTYILQILYIHKKGLFCKNCKDDLIANELAVLYKSMGEMV